MYKPILLAAAAACALSAPLSAQTKPIRGDFGYDASAMDSSVKPGDDFFIGWAQAWQGKVRDEQARQLILTDPHSPRRFRTNGIVRNVDAWYKAFNVQPGDKLYLPPEHRVHIW